MCVPIYKFAGAFLELRNSDVRSVLIQNWVQIMIQLRFINTYISDNSTNL